MDTISTIFQWLSQNEATLSAIAALAAIVGILYGTLAFIFPSLRLHQRVTGEAPATRAGKSSTPEKRRGLSISRRLPLAVSKSSIAVLPLRTLSRNEDDEYLAAGIASEIIADLAQVPDLRVASHVASFSFQGENIDLKEVADVLSIRYVLTGSFQRHEDRIRVMVELTDAYESEQLWASSYERRVEDLFAVQAEIAEATVGAIGGQLKLADTRIATEWPTKRLDAWGLVQKAFHFWLTSFDPAGFAKALGMLRRAVAMDPGYAGAHASLAMILSQMSINAMSQDEEKDSQEALEMIEKAVKLEPNDLTVLENAGLVWTHQGQGLRAREALRHAVQIAPLDLIAWGYLGFNLGWIGTAEDAEEAVEILDRLLSIAPKHPSRPYWEFFKCGACTRLDRLDEAIAAGEASLHAQPSFYLNWIYLANCFGRQGRMKKAREAMNNAAAINPAMTPEFFEQQTYELCMSPEASEPFLTGLRAAGILAVGEKTA